MADYDRYPNDERGYGRGRQWNRADSRSDFDRDRLDTRTGYSAPRDRGEHIAHDPYYGAYGAAESRSFERDDPRPSPRGGMHAYGAGDSARGYRPSRDRYDGGGYESYAFNPYGEGFTSRDRQAVDDHHRGFWTRAQDEVASWLGDRAALERRIADMREAGHSHYGKGPKNYRRSDDRIREDVSDRLADDDWLDASDIEVKVENGEVTLSGSVHDRDAKRRAENLAERCGGVTHVQNNLRPASLSGASAASGMGINTKLDDQAAGRA